MDSEIKQINNGSLHWEKFYFTCTISNASSHVLNYFSYPREDLSSSIALKQIGSGFVQMGPSFMMMMDEVWTMSWIRVVIVCLVTFGCRIIFDMGLAAFQSRKHPFIITFRNKFRLFTFCFLSRAFPVPSPRQVVCNNTFGIIFL